MSPASLYVFGHTGVGKTLVITTLLRQLNVGVIVILPVASCSELCGVYSTLLFEFVGCVYLLWFLHVFFPLLYFPYTSVLFLICQFILLSLNTLVK